MKKWQKIIIEILALSYMWVLATRVGYAAVDKKTVEAERAAVEVTAEPVVTQIPLATLMPRDPELDSEAVAMARTLYGQARWNSEDAQRAVAWLIINRVESSLYPDSVEEVCEQPSQWMGEGNQTYTEDLYQLALEVLTTWRAGGMRPVGADFLFLNWSQDCVELRTSFNETDSTRYWRCG